MLVTYKSKQNDGSYLSQASIPVSVSAINEVEISQDGGVPVQYDCTWRFPTKIVDGIDSILGYVPKPADIIVDANLVNYVVQTVDFSPFFLGYILVARRFGLEPLLQSLITIRRAALAIDSWGSKVTTYTNESGVAAHLQPIGNDERDERGKRDWARTFWLFLNTEEDLGNRDVVEDEDGNVYRLITDVNKSRIDTVQKVLVESQF